MLSRILSDWFPFSAPVLVACWVCFHPSRDPSAGSFCPCPFLQPGQIMPDLFQVVGSFLSLFGFGLCPKNAKKVPFCYACYSFIITGRGICPTLRRGQSLRVLLSRGRCFTDAPPLTRVNQKTYIVDGCPVRDLQKTNRGQLGGGAALRVLLHWCNFCRILQPVKGDLLPWCPSCPGASLSDYVFCIMPRRSPVRPRSCSTRGRRCGCCPGVFREIFGVVLCCSPSLVPLITSQRDIFRSTAREAQSPQGCGRICPIVCTGVLPGVSPSGSCGTVRQQAAACRRSSVSAFRFFLQIKEKPVLSCTSFTLSRAAASVK